MSFSSRFSIAIKALRQLGFTQVALNAFYRFGLLTGITRRIERREKENRDVAFSGPPFPFPKRDELLEVLGDAGLQALLAEADEIVAGKVRLFGGEPVELYLAPPAPLAHWTAYEMGRTPLPPANLPTYQLPSTNPPTSSDPKFTWEPARFGWDFVLGRAYHASGDEKYAKAFWRGFESFNAANPPYLGPNWMSGQEVGLRLMAFVWAAQVFAVSQHSAPARLSALTAATAAHAARILPTMLYARSQNNNHLLTEAAALYTAALALPEHPQAAKWRRLGQHWLEWCFTHQIDAYGEYIQHSTNYQRLMLQTALWVRMVSGTRCQVPGLSEPALSQLGLATHWLLSLLDPESGCVPNLGANDGALILPLSTCGFADYRPVAQSASRAFLGHSLPAGPWDEMSLWFGLPHPERPPEIQPYPGDHIYASHSWGYLRAVNYRSRPSHADQLHFDLWWRGLNIARDAGTYLYNAPPPWDNRLAGTLIHNTVSVDGLEQMTRAGRFLYLDWPAAGSRRHFESDADYIQRSSAWTDAYARLGVRHERIATVYNDERWLVRDELSHAPLPGQDAHAHLYRLHWLLPDWECERAESEESAESAESAQSIELRLKTPYGWMTLSVSSDASLKQVSLVRAAEYLHGSGAHDPVRGWVSPTYAHKLPALSLAIEVESFHDIVFTSQFLFPEHRSLNTDHSLT